MQQKVKILLIYLVLTSSIQGFSQGKIIIQSDATGTGSLIVADLNSTIEVEAQRYIPKTNWHIISSAVSNQALGTFVADVNNDIGYNATFEDFDMAPYDETADIWSPYTKDDNLNSFGVGTGYSTRRANIGTVTFSGTVNSGVIDVDIFRNNFGWNALGNPYTCPLRVKGKNSFLEQNFSALDESYAGLYIWDQGLNDFQVIAESGFTFPAPGGETQLDQNFIDLGQGFVIKAKEASAVSFTPLMQDHDTTSIPFKSGEIDWPALRLSASIENGENKTVFGFNDNMTLGLDPSYDVGKFKGNPNLSLYSRLLDDNGVDFLTQCLPLTGYESYRIPLGLDCTSAGEVSFSLEKTNLPSDMQVYIEDTDNNLITRLDNSGEAYKTYVGEEQKGIGRFFLLTSNQLLTSSKKIEFADYNIFQKNRKIIIHGNLSGVSQVRLYNIDGRLFHINQQLLEQSVYEIEAEGLSPGVYIVQLEKYGALQSKKLILTGR